MTSYSENSNLLQVKEDKIACLMHYCEEKIIIGREDSMFDALL